MKAFTACVALVLVAGGRIGADEPLAWPQFRGPNGSGVAEGERPPVRLDLDEGLKWKVAVPSGLSSPVVAGELLVMTALDDGKLFTIAYRRSDGSEAWRAQAPAPQLEKYHATEGSPAASTPATDGRRIVSYFGSCGLYCYDLAGNELWRLEMPPVTTAGDFGSGVSPIIADGLVVLVRDQLQGSKILALDAATGTPKWETPRQSRASYSTPVVWDAPSGKEVVVAGHARMIGYDLATGSERWSAAGVPSACCSSPVIAEGVVYFAGSAGGGEGEEAQTPTFDAILKDLDADQDGAISRAEGEKPFAGFFDNQDVNKDGQISRDEWDAIIQFFAEGQNSAFALSAGGTGDVTQSHVLWKQAQGLPYIPSAIVYRGQYVLVKDGGIVTSYDAKTGVEISKPARTAAAGNYYASPVAANGHIYLLSLDGGVTVLRLEPGGPVVVTKNPELGERTAATPAIADDTIYIRTDRHLYAFAEPGSGLSVNAEDR